MKEIDTDSFRVTKKISLSNLSTKIKTSATEKEMDDHLNQSRNKISKIQEKMYAHNRYGVLICLQGMDTSGKDSLIREVFKEINPRGIVVHSFKTPNSTELEHDYLWRHYIALPEKGKVAVFNRSHYENVLVTRVHPEYIMAENIPGFEKVENITESFWEKRMEQIRNFEKHISENGIIVLKFYFHMSKEEQRQRLLRRLEEGKHNWKFSVGDLKERERWDDYIKYYEEAIIKTSTENAPWFVIPADDKEYARCIVGSIVLDELKKYHEIDEPELDEKVKANITMYREMLEKEK